jgi:hypothetical protein
MYEEKYFLIYESYNAICTMAGFDLAIHNSAIKDLLFDVYITSL